MSKEALEVLLGREIGCKEVGPAGGCMESSGGNAGLKESLEDAWGRTE